MNDEDNPIIAEVRKAREELLARFGGDLRALGQYAYEAARKRGVKLVSYPPRRVSPAEQTAARTRLQELLEQEGRTLDPTVLPPPDDNRQAG
jgi:hypothetical protein